VLARNFFIRYISGYRDFFQTFKIFGFIGLLDEIRNRSKIWSIKDYKTLEGETKAESSSITDEPNYLTVCTLAQKNKDIFSKFKSCHEYRLVLEHVSRLQGEKYLTQIIENQRIIDNLKEITSKEIGDPFRYKYLELGSISPTQIRYAKILQDLERMFDFSKIRQIVEIGVGNGGQAAQICNLHQLESYTLIDLKPVLGLTQILLSDHKFEPEFKFLDPARVRSLSSDLFLSNYAFSELNKISQDVYIENVLKNSKCGFMLYNHIHPNPENAYSAIEILKRIPKSAIFAEEPLTFLGNVVVAWGFDEEKVSKYFSRISQASI
jgi:putative sugar O-methyltransferase